MGEQESRETKTGDTKTGGAPCLAAVARHGNSRCSSHFRTPKTQDVTSSQTIPFSFPYPSTVARDLRRFYGGRDLHFLTFSCYQRQPLLTAARRDLFLEVFERVRRRYRFVVLGYVVMPEHVHLLVSEPQRETLSTAVQALKLGFVRKLEGPWFPGLRLPCLAKTARHGAPRFHVLQAFRTVFGRRGFTISTYGPRRNESRSCDISTGTQ